ncbi:MAG: acetoacetate decarboxylase family protein [Acidimicrobiia bacterium]|nr:acetoacetate decarboxylase family protein [Acidimicrobiia bacterium]
MSGPTAILVASEGASGPAPRRAGSVGSVTITDQTPAYLVQGQEVRVPVEVRSAKMVQASWLVPATAAQQLVEPSGLQVVRIAGTLAMCSIAAVQYTDSDLGPYNEIAVAFVVEPHDGASGASAIGGGVTTLIHRLPVNQTFTCEAGRDIWGFPKWVADITWRESGRRTEVAMLDDGELVLGLAVRRSPIPAPAQEIEMSCYSHRDGTLRRTPWTNRVSDARVAPAGARLELGTRHPMATELRDLGLPKRPVFSMSVGHLGELRRRRGGVEAGPARPLSSVTMETEVPLAIIGTCVVACRAARRGAASAAGSGALDRALFERRNEPRA